MADLKTLQVAFHTDNQIVAPDPEIVESVHNAAAALANAGSKVEEACPPGIGETFEIYRGLSCADGGAGLKELLATAGTERIHTLLQQALELQQRDGISMGDYGRLAVR